MLQELSISPQQWSKLEQAFAPAPVAWQFQIDHMETDEGSVYASLSVRYRDDAIGIIVLTGPDRWTLVLDFGSEVHSFPTPERLVAWLRGGPL